MPILIQEEIISNSMLIKQYKKEIYQLENNIGIARHCSNSERKNAIKDLEYHVRDLENANKRLLSDMIQEEICYG